MSKHKGWLPREGFTADIAGAFIKQTVLNPALTLPLLLAAQYTSSGELFASQHPVALKRLKLLLYVGLARVANRILNKRALNNGVTAKYDWEKEVAVVTGGSDGIGKEIVLMLAEQGLKVAVLDVQELTYTAPSNVSHHTCDITSVKEIEKAAAEIRKKHGNPTILVNNAGVARGKSILDSTESDVRLTFDVNTISHYHLAREFVPSMTASNHGTIVTVASLAAYVCAPDMVDYASSKAAALSFHEGLTAELVTRYSAPAVRTILVTQGFTETKLFKGFYTDNSFMTPTLHAATVAEATVKKILSGESGQIVLPGSSEFTATSLRALPFWVQIGLRKSLEKVMKKWEGRQVMDPEVRYAGAGME